MLEAYKKKYHKNNFQYVLIGALGKVIKSDDTFISTKEITQIQELHPFFEILTGLILTKDESLEFSCINLDLENHLFTTDVTFHIQSSNEILVIIEDLTKHYNSYQLSAQTRNVSIINSQILELKNKYLLEKETFKNNFIANFSHQLRNPITASLIFSKLLIKGDLNEEQKNYLEIVRSANKDLKNRIEDILDLSKIQSGKLILSEKVFNLKDLLNDITSGYKYIATKKKLDFKVTLDDKLPNFIKGDQYRLKQILGNLLNNAITFTNKGEIHLSISLNFIRAQKASLHIEVTDTGIGIEPENIKHIFERFTKIGSIPNDDKNIGLGLSVVKHLISEMNGNINVKSKVNEGSKFTCNLSFRLSDYNQELKDKLLNKQLPKLNKKYNVLLVEDSEIIQVSILKVLAVNGNFYLNIISKGKELIPTLLKQEVDLILLSNTIQNFSASELTSSVRSLSKEYKKTPVIILSSEAFKDDIKHFKKAGVNDVLTKPFDENNLLTKMYKYLK